MTQPTAPPTAQGDATLRDTTPRETTPRETTRRLTADVYDTPGGETYVIEIPIPGLSPDEIYIEVEAHLLTVRTQPSQDAPDDRRYLQRERVNEPMSRVFEFPMDIDTDNVRATLDKGLLKILVPKAAAGRRRTIRVGQSA
jgi:HSP20 family protein